MSAFKCPKCGNVIKRGLTKEGRVPKHKIPRTPWQHKRQDDCPWSGVKIKVKISGVSLEIEELK